MNIVITIPKIGQELWRIQHSYYKATTCQECGVTNKELIEKPQIKSIGQITSIVTKEYLSQPTIKYYYLNDEIYWSFEDSRISDLLNKEIFLSKSDAEQALKERNNE